MANLDRGTLLEKRALTVRSMTYKTHGTILQQSTLKPLPFTTWSGMVFLGHSAVDGCSQFTP